MSVLLSLAAISESDSSISFLCISCFSSDVSEQIVPTLTPPPLAPSGNYFMELLGPLNVLAGYQLKLYRHKGMIFSNGVEWLSVTLTSTHTDKIYVSIIGVLN